MKTQMDGLHLSPIMKTRGNVFVSIGIVIYTVGNRGTSKGASDHYYYFTLTSTTTVVTTASSGDAAATVSW